MEGLGHVVKRSKPLKRATRVRPVRSGGPRRGPKGVEPEKWRNASYRTWLRKNGMCEACSRMRARPMEAYWELIDFCHGPVTGMGSKGPDAEGILLCRP